MSRPRQEQQPGSGGGFSDRRPINTAEASDWLFENHHLCWQISYLLSNMSDGRREISARPPTRLGSRVSAPSVNYSVALFKTPSRKRGRVHRKDLPACLALCGAVIGSAAEKLALWSSRHGDSPPSRHHSLLFYIQRNSLSGRRGRRGARLLASSFKCNFIETFRAALQNFNT